MNWKRYIPILQWLPNYDTTNLSSDILAGITVGVMVIPQGMAYGDLAGLPPIYGLYATLLPMIIYAILGTSRQLVVGPTAMVCLLIASGLSGLVAIGSADYLSWVLLLSFLVGLVQFSFGIFRLGFFVNFLSHPVLSGFLSAAAIIIIVSQLKKLTGATYEAMGHHGIGELFDFLRSMSTIDIPTSILGIIGIATILTIKFIQKSIPGPLVLLVISIGWLYLYHSHYPSIAIVRDIPRGFPSFQLPSFSWNKLQQLTPTIFTISLIGILESIAIAKLVQSKHKEYELLPNQELRAIGMANLVGSFFQAFPAAGSVSRTAVNDEFGAKSGIASLVAALIVGLTLLFLTPLFYYLPNTILAAIIIAAVLRLVDYQEALFLWKSDRRDFWMLLITFLATLLIGIEEGILLGIFISLLMVLYKTTRPHITFLGRIPETEHYKNTEHVKQLIQRKDVLIIRPDTPLFFANIGHFKETLQAAINQRNKDLQLLILNADCITELDSSATQYLRELLTQCLKDNIVVYFTGVSGAVYTQLKKGEVLPLLKGNFFFESEQNAVDYFDKQMLKRKILEGGY